MKYFVYLLKTDLSDFFEYDLTSVSDGVWDIGQGGSFQKTTCNTQTRTQHAV